MRRSRPHRHGLSWPEALPSSAAMRQPGGKRRAVLIACSNSGPASRLIVLAGYWAGRFPAHAHVTDILRMLNLPSRTRRGRVRRPSGPARHDPYIARTGHLGARKILGSGEARAAPPRLRSSKASSYDPRAAPAPGRGARSDERSCAGKRSPRSEKPDDEQRGSAACRGRSGPRIGCRQPVGMGARRLPRFREGDYPGRLERCSPAPAASQPASACSTWPPVRATLRSARPRPVPMWWPVT